MHTCALIVLLRTLHITMWLPPLQVEEIQEAVRDYQAWLDYSATLSVATESNITVFSNGKEMMTIRSSSRRSGQNYFFSSEPIGDMIATVRPMEYAFGRNSKYFFTLHRSEDRTKWRVASVVNPGGSYEQSLELIRPPSLRGLLDPHFVDQNTARPVRKNTIIDIMALPNIKVISVMKNGDHLEINFSYDHGEWISSQQRFPAQGVLRVLPARRHATAYRSISCDMPGWHFEEELSNEFEGDPRHPFPTKTEVVTRRTLKDKTVMEERIVTSRVTKWQGLSEADFTLTAFGLPEPFGVEWERPTPWWLYLAGGGAGLLFLMTAVYRLRRIGWLGGAAA